MRFDKEAFIERQFWRTNVKILNCSTYTIVERLCPATCSAGSHYSLLDLKRTVTGHALPNLVHECYPARLSIVDHRGRRTRGTRCRHVLLLGMGRQQGIHEAKIEVVITFQVCDAERPWCDL